MVQLDGTLNLCVIINLTSIFSFLNDTRSEGNSVLCICRATLLHHPTTLIFKPLGEILQFCIAHYDDVDVRDRAHFYYQLLTHVPSSKLKVGLNLFNYTVPFLRHTILRQHLSTFSDNPGSSFHNPNRWWRKHNRHFHDLPPFKNSSDYIKFSA